MEVNLVSAEFALRESLSKENSPLENLGKVHHTVKWQKNYFITVGFGCTGQVDGMSQLRLLLNVVIILQ